MDFDFTPYFRKYEAISSLADQMFEKVRQQHPMCVKCRIGCSDCCHALFDLTLIEALYINHHFNREFSGEKRERLLEKANRADRIIYKIKRKAYKEVVDGRDEADVLQSMAEERAECPMIDAEEMCELYAYRPITCRLYGIPTAINGKGHTCGKSGFQEGEAYPTVNIDSLQRMLYELSEEMVREMKSRHVKMGELLVPLSMAVLTEYNDEYLGVSRETSDRTPSDDADGGGSDG